MSKTLLPMAFETAMSLWPSRATRSEPIASGTGVPAASTVTPMMAGWMPHRHPSLSPRDKKVREDADPEDGGEEGDEVPPFVVRERAVGDGHLEGEEERPSQRLCDRRVAALLLLLLLLLSSSSSSDAMATLPVQLSMAVMTLSL